MKKTKKAIILGAGIFSEVASFLLEKDSEYEVCGYTASKSHIKESTYLGKEMVAFEEVEQRFNPREYEMFVAIGYVRMNSLRAEFMEQAKQKKYKLLSYVSSRAQHWGDTKIGENVFIFENNNLQPFVEIGDGSILWSGNFIGHHAKIGKYCFLASHVTVSGNCTVEDYTFIGANATLTDNINIATKNLIGAGALIAKSTNPEEVYIGDKTKVSSNTSDRYFK